MMEKLEDLLFQPLSVIAEKIKKKEVSPVELVESLLERIDRIDPHINSYISVNYEGALRVAEQCEEEIVRGNYRGSLHGIPIGLKDMIDTKDLRTTYGSPIYENHVPKYDAEVVKTIKRAGGIVIGKQNTHQFAYGPTGDRSHFGPVKNPFHLEKMSGGSSSGSAAGIAAGLCAGSLGTDTGGSVRIPSAFCATVGMKPTYNLIDKIGVFPLSKTLDHVGPITRTVLDNALMLNVLQNREKEKEDYTRNIGKDVKGMLIGVPRNFYYEYLHPEVEVAVMNAMKILESLGAEIIELEIPGMKDFSFAQRMILRYEAYSVHKQHLALYPDDWDDEVKERLLTGKPITEEEYNRALVTREVARNTFTRIFEKVEALLTPTVPILPPNINYRYASDVEDDANHIRWTITKLTGPTNLNGFPGLSLPCGFSSEGLPIGVQLIGDEFNEAVLYQIGHVLEQEVALSITDRLDQALFFAG